MLHETCNSLSADSKAYSADFFESCSLLGEVGRILCDGGVGDRATVSFYEPTVTVRFHRRLQVHTAKSSLPFDFSRAPNFRIQVGKNLNEFLIFAQMSRQLCADISYRLASRCCRTGASPR